MSQIIPYSSFKIASKGSNVSDFPALKMLFHADDYTAGNLTWTDRVSGIVANLTAGASKDANGVYTTVTNSVASLSGTLPVISKYPVCLSIGIPSTTSPVVGLAMTIGSGIGAGIGSTGIVTDSTVTQIGGPAALSGSVTTNNTPSAQAARFDFVSTGALATRIVRALGNNTDQTVGSGSTDLITPGQIILGAPMSQELTFGCLINNGTRGKIYALFDFSTSLSMANLQLAAADMART